MYNNWVFGFFNPMFPDAINQFLWIEGKFELDNALNDLDFRLMLRI